MESPIMVNPTGRSAQMVVGVCLGLLELFPALSMALVSMVGILLVAKATAGIHSTKLMGIVARHRPTARSLSRAFLQKNQAQ
jgi:hypothetical protein